MRTLLVVERIVLEVIYKGPKTIEEIVESTGLNIEIVNNILKGFIIRGEVDFYNNLYHLLKKTLLIYNYSYIKSELKELFVAIINQSFIQEKGQLNVKKLWLDKEDERVFERHIDNLDFFIKHTASKNKSGNIKDKKVIYWGHTNYGGLVDSAVLYS